MGPPTGLFLYDIFFQPSYFVHDFTFNFTLRLPVVICHSCMISSVTTIEGWFIYNTNWDHIIEAAVRRNESA